MAKVRNINIRKLEAEIEDRLSQLTDAALECHDGGHAWRRVKTTQPDDNVVEVERLCAGCGAYRIDMYNLKTAELLKRKYEYPDGYTLPRAKGQTHARVTRIDYRRAALPRYIQEGGK